MASNHLYTLAEFGQRIGVKRDTIKKYRLPEPDASYSRGGTQHPLWSQSTIDAWESARPSRQKNETNRGAPNAQH